jgi:hypothetical protein
VLLLIAAAVVYVVRSNPYRLDDFASPDTQLAEGLEVAEGSVLLGPVFPIPVYKLNNSPGWFALLAVTGTPLEVWKEYLDQFLAAIPSAAEQFEEVRCRPGGASAFLCSAGGTGVGPDGDLMSITADMSSNSDDPTGRYVIKLTVTHSEDGMSSALSYPYPFLGEKAPEPHPARRPPRAGGLLARHSVNDRRYVLLEGSKMAAVTGRVGTFGILLKVESDADIDRVARGYAAQSVGPDNPVRTPVQVERFGAVTTLRRVSSLAGSNDATVWAVDRPGRDSDYLFYRVFSG